MPAKNIVEEFFDKKVLSILKLFLFDETSQFYLRELSKKARVPVATTFRIIKKLKDMGIIEETVIKKTKLYSLSHNKNTKMLGELLEEKKTVIGEFVEYVSKLPNVHMIVKHGEDSKDKANIIVIGPGVDSKAVKEKVGDIKDKYNFTIIEYVLDPGVFNQMSQGGLITGKKVILWEKSS
ncbi:winged helix-turn-helix domain-containing protein [Candidatus Woesearchaeota archaeon]|nr:winged helix-turn-helix domain-containing protein [Candidatus Woesearchaeota archaeon]